MMGHIQRGTTSLVSMTDVLDCHNFKRDLEQAMKLQRCWCKHEATMTKMLGQSCTCDLDQAKEEALEVVD